MNGAFNKTKAGGTTAWPIVIASFLAVFALAVIGMGVWAGSQRSDLVSPDYYKLELRYSERMQSAARGAGVDIASSKEALTIRFPPAVAAAGLRGAASFYRPSDSTLDFETALQPDAATGAQVFDTRRLRPGLWHLRLTWQAGGVEHYREEAIMLGTPETHP